MTTPGARRASGASTPATSRCAPDACETPAMKKYVAGFPPAAVARDQLKYAVAELSTHENQRVTKALNDGLQAALTGTKTAGAGDEGCPARGRPHPAGLQVNRRARMDRPRSGSIGAGCPAGRCRRGAGPLPDRMRMIATATIHALAAAAAGMRAAGRCSRTGRRSRRSSTASTRRRSRAGRASSSGSTTTQTMFDDPVFWQALCEQPLVRASAPSRSRSRWRC